ncbi:MAG: branched-chain amino acid ABC transporter permease [Paracoccaceae bacterium]
MFEQTPTKTVTMIAVLAGLSVYTITGSYFGRELVVEVAILAILAVSLDMVAGYGGMVSLCHGSIFGIGAYSFAVVNVLLGGTPALGLLAAIVLAGTFGFAVGAVTSRTRGIFFIMATLAFGQMVYVLIFDSETLGGDDGMWGLARLDLSAVGIDLNDGVQFAIFSIFCVGLTYTLAAWILRSAFGRTLSGIHENEDRMRALGTSVWKFKAIAFGLSGALAGLSGALAAQQTMFVSPDLIVWTVSGEVLIVVILGGLGTLVGPVVGAVVLVFLKHEISDYTNYWHIIIGLVLIVTVMAGGRGIYGGIEELLRARRVRATPASGAGSDA